MILSFGFGDDIGLLLGIPIGELAAQSGRPHGLQHGQKTTDDSQRMGGVDLEQYDSSWLIDRSYKSRLDREGLIGVSQCCGFRCNGYVSNDIPSQNRPCRTSHKKREREIPEDFQRVSPGFKRAAFVGKNGKFPAHLVERCPGPRQASKSYGIGFQLDKSAFFFIITSNFDL